MEIFSVGDIAAAAGVPVSQVTGRVLRSGIATARGYVGEADAIALVRSIVSGEAPPSDYPTFAAVVVPTERRGVFGLLTSSALHVLAGTILIVSSLAWLTAATDDPEPKTRAGTPRVPDDAGSWRRRGRRRSEDSGAGPTRRTQGAGAAPGLEPDSGSPSASAATGTEARAQARAAAAPTSARRPGAGRAEAGRSGRHAWRARRLRLIRVQRIRARARAAAREPAAARASAKATARGSARAAAAAKAAVRIGRAPASIRPVFNARSRRSTPTTRDGRGSRETSCSKSSSGAMVRSATCASGAASTADWISARSKRCASGASRPLAVTASRST